MKQQAIRGFAIIIIWGILLSGCGRQKEEFLLLAAGNGSQTEKDMEAVVSPVQAGQEATGASGEVTQQDLRTTGQTAEGQKDEQTSRSEDMFVDVCGAVKNPGVYRLSEGSRVFQAIQKAGGFTAEAAPASVNQAQLLEDGLQLYVPTLEEIKVQGLPAVTLPGQEHPDPDLSKININTADKQELMSLNGIGETRAEAILSYREAHGRFLSVDELLQVSGIKEGTLAKIRDRIVAE